MGKNLKKIILNKYRVSCILDVEAEKISLFV